MEAYDLSKFLFYDGIPNNLLGKQNEESLEKEASAMYNELTLSPVRQEQQFDSLLRSIKQSMFRQEYSKRPKQNNNSYELPDFFSRDNLGIAQ